MNLHNSICHFAIKRRVNDSEEKLSISILRLKLRCNLMSSLLEVLTSIETSLSV